MRCRFAFASEYAPATIPKNARGLVMDCWSETGMFKKAFNVTYRVARRIVITVIGFTVVIIGVIMLFTPGPGMIVIPVGIGILGLEFLWARRLLTRMKEKAKSAIDSVTHRKAKNDSQTDAPQPLG